MENILLLCGMPIRFNVDILQNQNSREINSRKVLNILLAFDIGSFFFDTLISDYIENKTKSNGNHFRLSMSGQQTSILNQVWAMLQRTTHDLKLLMFGNQKTQIL